MMLGGLAMDIEIGRLLVVKTAWELGQGGLARKEVSMAKIHVANLLHKAADTAIRINGGRGYSKDTVLNFQPLTLLDFLERTLSIYPDQTAVVWRDRRWTPSRVRRVRRALRRTPPRASAIVRTFRRSCRVALPLRGSGKSSKRSINQPIGPSRVRGQYRNPSQGPPSLTFSKCDSPAGSAHMGRLGSLALRVERHSAGVRSLGGAFGD